MSLWFLKKNLGMKFLFCMHVTSRFSRRQYYHFWLVWPGMSKVSKIANFQYLRNVMLDYLDFWYVHVPPIHNQSIQKTNLQYLKNGMLECHNVLHPDRLLLTGCGHVCSGLLNIITLLNYSFFIYSNTHM